MTGKRYRYIARVGIGIDQLVNTFLGGDPDETLSARAWRNKDRKKRWGCIRILIDGLFFWQQDHCYQAYRSEHNQRQIGHHYRK